MTKSKLENWKRKHQDATSDGKVMERLFVLSPNSCSCKKTPTEYRDIALFEKIDIKETRAGNPERDYSLQVYKVQANDKIVSL